MPEARYFRRGVWVMVQDLQPGDLLVGNDNRLCAFSSKVEVDDRSRLQCEPFYRGITNWFDPETLVEIAVPEITFEQYRAKLQEKHA